MPVTNISHSKKQINITPKNLVVDWAKHHRIIICMVFVLIVSTFLRLYDLGTESIWLDEAESIKESSLNIQEIASHSNQPPLYFLMLRLWISIFGTGEIALRSLSAILGILVVVIIYFTGSSLVNKKIGLIGAFLSSFSFFLIYHSQDARAYSLLLLLSTLFYWCFIEILRHDNKRFYIAYVISGTLLIFTHFYSLFIIASQVLFFLIFIKKYTTQRWKYIISLGVLGLAIIPMLFLLKNRIFAIANTGFWISEPGISSIINTFVGFSGIGSTKYVIFAIFLAIAIWGIMMINRFKEKLSKRKLKISQHNPIEDRRFEPMEIIILLILWLLIPILIPFIESKLMTPVYQAKYVIGVYPAFCILVAIGLHNIKWTWVFYPILTLIVILSSFGLHDYYKYDVKEQWRETAHFIETKSTPDDIIVFCEGYYQNPFDYYFKGNIKKEGIVSVEDANIFLSSSEGIAINNQGRLWLVLAYNKAQIYSLFETSYGKDNIKLKQQYTGITIVLFDTFSS